MNILKSCAILGAFAPVAFAQNVEVIYSKSDASSTSDINGTLDLTGMPVASKWRALEDFTVRPDGGDWVVKGRTRLGGDLETILVRGTGTSGTMFCQEGQPFQGAAAGELYDFFDTPRPVSYDSTGRIGFSARARGGVTTDNEKVITVDLGGVHTQVLQQGDLLMGLLDIPANPSGDETLGNSVGSVHLLDDGRVGYVVTPIGNCSSFRYPALLRGDTGFQQSGVSAVGGGVWDTFGLDGAGGTPDGAHWYADGDDEGATTTDLIFVVDGNVILREGSVIPGSALIFADVFQAGMATNGDYIVRGDNPATAPNPQFVLMNGTKLLETGDSVEGGAETWGTTISAVAINAAGDWAVQGRTSNPDPARDEVIVVNGVVVMREGDAVDLDGNGLLDDDAFIGRGVNTNTAFSANDLAVSEDGYVWSILTLHNAAGMDLNDSGFTTPDAFARKFFRAVSPEAICFGDGTGGACPCANNGAAGNGCANSVFAAGANLAATGTSSIGADTLVLAGSGMPNSSVLYFQGTATVNGGLGSPFGDGLRCAGGSVVRLGTKQNTAGMSQYPAMGDLSVSVRGLVVAPGTRVYQAWYRNAAAFCTVDTFNLSNGLNVTWAP